MLGVACFTKRNFTIGTQFIWFPRVLQRRATVASWPGRDGEGRVDLLRGGLLGDEGERAGLVTGGSPVGKATAGS